MIIMIMMNLLKKLFTVPSETLERKDFTISVEEIEAPLDHEKTNEEEGGGGMMRLWDCGSPLYDSYELASLSHVIERHFMILPSLGGSSSQESSAASSNDAIALPPPLNDAATKEVGGGSSSMVAYFTGFLERSMSRRKKMEEESEQKSKKMKLKVTSPEFFLARIRGRNSRKD